MTFPQQAQAIVVDLYARHQDLARGTDDQRRALTRKMAEQIRFTLGPAWGTKSADRTRPPSKDAIAWNRPEGLVCWDWQNGSTRAPMVPPLFHDIPDQTFIEVSPVDHLGLGGVVVPPIAPPVVVPPLPPVDVAAVLAQLTRLASRLDLLSAQIDAIAARPMPTYRGSVFGMAVTLTPEA